MAADNKAPGPDAPAPDASQSGQTRRQGPRPSDRRRAPGWADVLTGSRSKARLSLAAISIPFLAVMAAAAFCYFARPVLVPLVTAVTVAYILSPVVSFMSRKLPRWLAVSVVVTVALVFFGGVAFLAIQQGERLITDAPTYLKAIDYKLVEAETWTENWPEPFAGLTRDALGDLRRQMETLDLAAISMHLFSGIGSVLGFLGWVSLVALLAVFILLDMPRMQKQMVRAMGPRNEPAMRAALQDMDLQLRSFLSVKIGISVALGIVATFGLMLMNVPYAWVWGILTAMMNVVPYVGALISSIPPVIMVLIQNDSLLLAVLVTVFLTVLQQIEGNIVTPKLLENRMELNAVSVILATVVWGWLWGPIGLLLAVPITAMIKVVCDRVEPLRPIAILLG